jgi:hypothetical protein
MDPAAESYAVFYLNNHDGNRYYADKKLQLPLNPLGGYWWVIAEVESNVDVEGETVHFFIPEQVHFRPLDGLIPASVSLRVPINFRETASQGDLYAGSRIWQHNDGQIGLWWAPGPTENLLFSNAVTMLEATFPDSGSPVMVDIVESEWHGRVTFVANLIWPDSQPGMAWVVQDADYWLYILDIRTLDGEKIPPLIEEVASTFSFTE